jgi:predicted translin family RNA/ssDNA-binding protein
MKLFVSTFSAFEKIFEELKYINYPEELKAQLKAKKTMKFKARSKHFKPNFKG